MRRSPSLLGGVKTRSLGPWVVGWLGLALCQYQIIWYVRRTYTNLGPYVLIGARLKSSNLIDAGA